MTFTSPLLESTSDEPVPVAPFSSSNPLPGLPVIQTKHVPRGTHEFEERRKALLEDFQAKVPQEYYLDPKIIENPPIDVTGIPSTCGILTPEEVHITENYDAVALADAIANRKFTAVQVTTAYCKRSIIAHQLTCCLTQWFMAEAITQAKEMDDSLAKHGKTVGPLHGVPVSIKEHMHIAGTTSSIGFLGSMALDNEDCDMVAILRKLGAVFYCKTNQPQLIMHLETDSFRGRTLNPFNIHLSSGGSTGGEAALLAMKGSVLGVGTDIGGSIRGPAAFCGIYGFKPTSYTLPTKGYSSYPIPAELNILCSTGPMCRSLRDMDMFMRYVLAAKPHISDPNLIPIPWTGLGSSFNRPLKIGFIEHDGFIQPQPPVKRALAWAKSRLSDPQHNGTIELKPFKVLDSREAWSKVRRMYWPDGQEARDALLASGEPVHELTEWNWDDIYPVQTAHAMSVMRRERDEFRWSFVKSWNSQDVDIVIGPAFVGPASAHDTAFYWNYTSLYNLVDYPGVVVPTPIRAEAKETYDVDYEPLSDACQQVKELWEKGDFAGAPVNLQIVARKHHDNELFASLQVLQNILNLV